MTTEQIDLLVQIVAFTHFPNCILTKWAKDRECKERGVCPFEDLDNAFMKLAEELDKDFDQMERLAKKQNSYWTLITHLKSTSA